MFRPSARFALALLALVALGLALPSHAEARRYRTIVRRAPVVYAAPVVVRRAPVVVRAPYVGVGVGYGRVRVAAPGVGVYLGW
ncbi:hypothetical protein Pla108_02410 [Botrimarina colliarenosi]|uniref:Uncharacterized protein n=1 Tax=Botrimarina colliarenosi TaxID=2528001 RepID=A0A5C6AIT9_9BACT|nr:hypothetical protein [Botrimarina colliarenosi]TWT99306.1 hypothetical protein Pla108_02410 [Botrimarina colliarenosi]